jgi:uncharacterized protein YdgA (DUF945 family)
VSDIAEVVVALAALWLGGAFMIRLKDRSRER